MKNMILSSFFVILVLLVLIRVDEILYVKHDTRDVYKDLNEPYSIDMIFLGTSRMRTLIFPMYIFKHYGISSYNLSSNGQSYKTTVLMIKKYKPKYAVIDFTCILRDDIIPKQVDLVSLFPITERIQVARFLFGNEKYLNEINTIEKYHSRWKSLDKYDFTLGREYKYLKGNQIYAMFHKLSIHNISFIDEELNNYNFIDNVENIINIANETGTKIIFLIPTNIMENRAYYRIFKEYASKNNIDYIDYNTPELIEKLKFSYQNDMMDMSHVNMYGAYKVMDHLMPILIEKFNLKDQRNNPKYKSWHEDYIKYERVMNKAEIIEQSELDKWFYLSKYDNYTIMISSYGNNTTNRLSPALKSYLNQYGLMKYDTNDANARYIAIIDGGKVYYENMAATYIEYKGRVNNHFNLLLSSDLNQATINVSGTPRSKNKYGLNFVIYDKVNKEIVDSMWIDPNNPNYVNR